MRVILCVAIFVLAGSAIVVGDGPAKRPVRPPEVAYVSLTTLNARDTVSLLRTALRGDPEDSATGAVRFSVAPTGNGVMISGPRSQIEAVQELVRTMDRSSGLASAGSGDPTALMDATVYVLTIPAERIAKLSAPELTFDAGDPAKFQKLVAAQGSVQSSQRFVQRVNLCDGGKIMGGASVPFLAGRQKLASGQVNSQISYQDIGATITLSRGTGLGTGTGTASLVVDTSAMTSSATQTSGDVPVQVFNRVDARYDGPIADGKPIVIVGTAPASDAGGPAVACIARIVFSNANK